MDELPKEKPSGSGTAVRVIRNIFFKRFPTNLLTIIILVGLAVLVVKLSSPDELPVGGAIVDIVPDCPECVCSEQECEQDCSLCPIKTKVETEEVIRYQCEGGEFVDNQDSCKKEFPDVDEESSGTVEGVTLAIDDVEYERDGEEGGY